MSAPSLDGLQLRSGPDPVADLTMGLYEWRGDVWGVLSGAGHRRGYVTGTRTGDEVVLALATLDDAGRARGMEVRGVVLEHDGQVALDMDWDIAPARLVSAGWLDPGGPLPPPPDARPGPTGVVRLVEIDEHNLPDVLRVRTAPHQEDYVADNGRSIAEGLLCTPAGLVPRGLRRRRVRRVRDAGPLRRSRPRAVPPLPRLVPVAAVDRGGPPAAGLRPPRSCTSCTATSTSRAARAG